VGAVSGRRPAWAVTVASAAAFTCLTAQGAAEPVFSALPNGVSASAHRPDAYVVWVSGSNRSPLWPKQLCLRTARSVSHGDLLTTTGEGGCGVPAEYSLDPTTWTASLSGSVPTVVSVTVSRRVGRTYRQQSHRTRTSTATVDFTWTPAGPVQVHHVVYAGPCFPVYCVAPDAWLSRSARVNGVVSFRGLDRSYAGVLFRQADMTVGR